MRAPGSSAAWIPGFVLPGTEIATRLILDLCGGEAAAAVVAGQLPAARQPIRFRKARLAKLAGVDLDVPAIERILGDLGFAIEGGPETWMVTPPTWRHDVTLEACIVEELARVHGYEHIEPVAVIRDGAVGSGVLTPEQRRRGHVRRALAAQGLDRGGDLVVHAARPCAAFRCGRAGAARQSDQCRAGRAAAVDPAQSD